MVWAEQGNVWFGQSRGTCGLARKKKLSVFEEEDDVWCTETVTEKA